MSKNEDLRRMNYLLLEGVPLTQYGVIATFDLGSQHETHCAWTYIHFNLCASSH
jgi:hypothetical protein